MSGGAAAGTIAEALAAATDGLRASGSETARLDAELLLSAATGLSRTGLLTDSDRKLSGAEGRSFGAMVRRRIAHEPVAYILGRKGFRRIELKVDRRVLIPRPETELLVDLAVGSRPRTVLDVGTGSGAIALAVADELPVARVVAVDTSLAALDLARENAERLGLSERVDFEHGELPARSPEGGFDLLLANLPYVRESERAELSADVLHYEPAAALFSGPDGLDAIRGLLGRLGELRPAAVALEVGAGQAEEVAGLLSGAGYGPAETIPDLAGIPRVVAGSRTQGAT